MICTSSVNLTVCSTPSKTAPGGRRGHGRVFLKLAALPFLCRQRAGTAVHPEQVQMQDRLKKALAELQEGVAATKRMLLERCELKEDEHGQVRSIGEPLTSAAPLAPKATKPAV